MIFQQEWPQFSSACASWGLYKFFIGLVGKYILSINSKSDEAAAVIEEERLNFEENHHPEVIHRTEAKPRVMRTWKPAGNSRCRDEI